MNTFARTLITGSIACILSACGTAEVKTTEATPALTVSENKFVLDQLVGTWKSEDGKTFERWTKDGDNYRSFVYALNGADTVVNEQAIVYQEAGSWVFENTVSGQNQGKSTKFTSSVLKDNTIQFSNPQHDFPTDINYTLPDNETVRAFIVGPNNKGGKDTVPFNYRRVK